MSVRALQCCFVLSLISIPAISGGSISQLTKFQSANLQLPKPMSKQDLFAITRSSFETSDYLSDILKAASPNTGQGEPAVTALTAASASSVLFGALILPTLDLPGAAKNVIGAFCVFLPFAALALPLLFPTLLSGQGSAYTSEKEKERILYHEAGHVLSGYLCGVTIERYDISGEVDGSISIDVSDLKDLTFTKGAVDGRESILQDRLGKLLVVAMAGVVAETLRY
jgi:hypothetical protein